MANRLRRLRKSKGLTVREVADQLNIPLTTYREWEYGRAIRGEPYPRLAEIFSVSLSEIIRGEKIEKSSVFQTIETLESNIALVKKQLNALLDGDYRIRN